MATIRNLIIRIGVNDRAVRGGIDRVNRSLERLNRHVDQVGRLGRGAGLAVLAGSAVSLAAAAGPAAGGVAALAVSLGAAIAPAAGLAVALPAAAVAWKTSLAIMKLALDGFSDTLGKAVKGDLKGFREDLKKMPPEMRAVASQLGGALTGLQRNIQRSFFAPIAREAKGLGRQLRQPLWEGTQVAAAGLGRVGARILQVAREGRSIRFMSGVFRTISVSADAFGKGVAPLVRGLRDIAMVGLRQLPGVAGWLGRAAANTGRWLSGISASGKATRWFTFAVFTLGQMVGIVRNLGTFFGAVFRAATAGSGNLLVSINGITGALAKWSTSLDGANRLDAFFTRGKATAAQLWRIAVNLGTALAGIFGAASAEGASLLTSIEQITAKFAAWTQSAQGQQQLADTFAMLGQVARDVMTILPGLAGVIGVIANAFRALPPGVQGVVSQFLAWTIVIGMVAGKLGLLQPLLQVVGGWIARLVTALGTLIWSLTKAAAQFVWAGLKMAAQAAWTAARVVAGWVLMGVQAMIQAARMAAAWLIAMGPVGWIIAAVVALVALIILNWDKIKSWTVAAWEFVWGWIKKIAGFIWQLFLNWTIYGLIIKHWDKIKSGTAAAWNWVWSKLQSIAKAIVNIFMRFHPVGIVIRHWDQIKSGVANRATAMVGWLRGLPGRIVGALGNMGKLLYNSGKSLLIGLWNGLVSRANWLYRSIMSLVRDIIPGPVRKVLGIASPSKLFAGFGRNLGEGLAIGMRSSQGLVSRAAAGLAGAAVPSVTAGGWALATPSGVAASGGAGAGGGGIDYDRLATAVTSAMERRGVGAAYLDGRLVSQGVSQNLGRATDQRRRTG